MDNIKDVRLSALKLRNFKGFRDPFEFKPDGETVEIRGRNKAGKTTLVDAWTYLLFGRDSSGNHVTSKNFKIKPHKGGPEGSEIHHLTTEVEAKLEVYDGDELDKTVTLRKERSENWREDRATQEQRFKGHSTECYIDDVKVGNREFKEEVSGLIDEDTFKVITNPTFFYDQMDTENRRDMLLGMVEQPDQEEILNRKPELEEIVDSVEKRGLKGTRKWAKDKARDLNKELDRIPDLIDEADRKVEEVDLDRSEIENKLSELKEKKADLDETIAELKGAGKKAKLKEKLEDLKQERRKFKEDWQADIDETLEDAQDKVVELNRKLDNVDAKIKRKGQKISDKQDEVKDLETEIQQLRDEFDRKSEEKPEVCPTCGQELDDEAAKRVNREISEDLDNLNERGKAKKQEKKELEQEIETLKGEVSKAQDDAGGIEAELNRLEERIDELEDEREAYVEADKYEKLTLEIKETKEDLEGEKPPKERIKAREERSQVEERVEKLQTDLGKLDQIAKSQERVEELREKQRDLSSKLEEFEKIQHLAEQWSRAKMNLIETRINDQFELVNWTLFEEQINGGIEDVAYPTLDGTPAAEFSGAERVQAGLDIIQTLSLEKGIRAPIWIDGRESVTEIPHTSAQVINLFVDPEYDSLKVKSADATEKQKSLLGG